MESLNGSTAVVQNRKLWRRIGEKNRCQAKRGGESRIINNLFVQGRKKKNRWGGRNGEGRSKEIDYRKPNAKKVEEQRKVCCGKRRQ